jgi:hypothetical protein
MARLRPRTVASAAVGTILVVLLVATALLTLGPLTGRYRIVAVRSGSMQPELPTDAAVIVTPIPRRDVRAGDV